MSSGTIESITKVVKQEVPTEGMVTISLLEVDDTMFKNYRKRANEEHIVQLYREIKQHGQLTPCGGSYNEDGSKIGIWSGFCRLEALHRKALEKLVKEYNEANGKNSTDDGFIKLGNDGFASRKEREKIRQAGGEWQQKYDEALGAQMINFSVKPVENQTDAALKGISANTQDKPPLLDLIEKIEELCQEKEITAKKVATALGMSEGFLSSHRKIFASIPYLRELFKEGADLSALGFVKKEETEAERQTLITATNEYERRLGLTKDSPQAISFSHAREFANAVENKKEPMHLKGVARILKFLVQIDDNGKPTNRATPDWDIFRAKLSDARKTGKVEGEIAVASEAASAVSTGKTTAAGSVAGPIADINTLSKEQMDEIDKAAAAQPGHSAVAQSSPAVAGKVPALSAEDQAKMAEVEAANAGTVGTGSLSDEDLDGLMEPTDGELQTEELLAGVDEEVIVGGAQVPATEKVVDGAQRTKGGVDTTPESRYKVKPPEKIEQSINRVLDMCMDERATFIDQAGYVQSCLWMAGDIGLQDVQNKLQELYVTFGEKANRYVTALENAVKEARGEAVFAELQQMKPKFERPSLA